MPNHSLENEVMCRHLQHRGILITWQVPNQHLSISKSFKYYVSFHQTTSYVSHLFCSAFQSQFLSQSLHKWRFWLFEFIQGLMFLRNVTVWGRLVKYGGAVKDCPESLNQATKYVWFRNRSRIVWSFLDCDSDSIAWCSC